MSPSERDGGRVIDDYTQVEPFEICSIRPPTENYSLTFRLTRNCYWNRCKFCPVYKLGAKISRRSLGEVREDIKRAQLIDDILLEVYDTICKVVQGIRLKGLHYHYYVRIRLPCK